MENKEEIFQEKILNAKGYEELDEKDFLFSIKEKLQKLGDFTLIKNEDNIESRKAYYEVITNLNNQMQYTYIDPNSSKEQKMNDIMKLFYREIIESADKKYPSFRIIDNKTQEVIALMNIRYVPQKNHKNDMGEIALRICKSHEKKKIMSTILSDMLDYCFCYNNKCNKIIADCDKSNNSNYSTIQFALMKSGMAPKCTQKDGAVTFLVTRIDKFQHLQDVTSVFNANTDLPVTYVNLLNVNKVNNISKL